jgi:5-methylcytosine-specific restriction endonuclease McrA
MAHDRLDLRPNAQRRRHIRAKLLGDSGFTECVHCGARLDGHSLTMDRIEPGGSYRISNIQPSCMRCNIARGNKREWVHPAKMEQSAGSHFGEGAA